MSQMCKQFYDEWLNEKNICKKKYFFWVLVKDFHFPDIFYKIQNIN